MSLTGFGHGVRRFLNRPLLVMMVCLIFASVSMVFDGIFWRLWGLHHDHERLTSEMVVLKDEIKSLRLQLKQAKDPSYIERQARDRLDLVGENDLVFVFPDEVRSAQK